MVPRGTAAGRGGTRGATQQAPPTPAAGAPAALRAAPLSPSKASCVYWQCFSASAPLYLGPLGCVVCEVPVGTVLREARRCDDPFGGRWIATRAEDHSLLWFCPSHGNEAEGEGESALWKRVYDACTVNELSGSFNSLEESFLHSSFVSTENNTEPLPRLDAVLAHIRLLEQSWQDSSEYRLNGGRDWNAEYQRLVELSLFTVVDRRMAAREKLHDFMKEFRDAAEDVAMTVVSDLLRPTHERVAKGVTGYEKSRFYLNGLLAWLVLDNCTDSGSGKGDPYAWQVASHLFRAQQLLALEAPKRLLCTAPGAMVTFGGFRVWVTAIPPVETEKIIHLPLRKHETDFDVPNFVKTRMNDLGSALLLKAHTLRSVKRGGIETVLPVDVAVVIGRDKRLYIMGSPRLLPKVALAPRLANRGEGPNCSSALSEAFSAPRFRPEFLMRWLSPLNPDAFVEGATTSQDNADVIEATSFIRCQLIPEISAILGMQKAVDLPVQDSVSCTLCSRVMENELRFVVCCSVEQCCSICSHCYTQRLSEQRSAGQNMFSDAVRCDAAFRNPKGLVLQPSLSCIFHANGLNMRFLPYVYNGICEPARVATAHYCEIEMTARAAVHVLRAKLRCTSQTPDEVRVILQDFFIGLLQSSGSVAEKFWANELGPAIQRLYGPMEPFSTATMDVSLLYHRVSEISGVTLSDASVSSIRKGERPFLQLSDIQPLVKTLLPPLASCEALLRKLRANFLKDREALLLFWIGASANEEENTGAQNCDGIENDLEQPFYMTEEDV
ncbi:putative Clustered mitochondria Translation initiation factor eIF3 subunit [Trypanosoma vivax]|nr:putative Clustered mitochondria Translation initiation factor eIF3 subunit [Trypanosoma vivax]